MSALLAADASGGAYLELVTTVVAVVRDGRAAACVWSGAGARQPNRTDLCEHAFALSIKGRPHTWLAAAIRRGDLAGVRAAAAELAHHINLVDALAIVLLMADQRDHRYDRAAAKWLARLA